ncbi:MAG TPA: c-type cytochrome [Candidatus Dormibacteraeota bacterium]|nr:c-type cytochrome [Candidatus Dormibacteraeota bacterium]
MPRLRNVIALAAAAAALSALTLAHARAAADPYASGNATEGAHLVQSSGCEGCHGAGFTGGIGPKLVGIEKRLSADQIAQKILHPKAPMPSFGFTDRQAADLVAYLSGLDGGTGKPVVKIDPPEPTDAATVRVTFAGTPPTGAQVQAFMQMGKSSHGTGWVPLRKTADPHVLSAKVKFSMGGPWTLKVRYDGHEMDVPITVDG